MLNHFAKEVLSNRYLVNGAPVPFEPLAGNRGVIALDDANPQQAPLISALNDAAAQGRGGIVKISQADYEKKKLENSATLLTPSRRKSPLDAPLRIMPTQAPRVQNARPAAVPAVVNPTPPAPAQPTVSPREQHIAERVRERRQYRPATGKASKVKEQSLPEPPK